MAFVTAIERDDEREIRSVHPTNLKCQIVVGEVAGQKLLQLNTYGSSDRELPGKVSQTLQFGETTAKQLFEILRTEFGLGN
ncbi:hypothetical protein ACRARG_08665 [Pseudooceanicola sp. C21-150M6]|uniref:hypothetical protein n=1 Tax=Pseudooceanicola sp. C21-150M6 TaxID=3434355 RepID=UPI003D7F8600